jgi:hypothetical protein
MLCSYDDQVGVDHLLELQLLKELVPLRLDIKTCVRVCVSDYVCVLRMRMYVTAYTSFHVAFVYSPVCPQSKGGSRLPEAL